MPATITVTDLGGGNFRLVVDETLATTATEVTLDLAALGLPFQGRFLRQQADLTAGTGVPGATIDPILVTSAGSKLATDTVVENGAPLASPDNQAAAGWLPYYSTGMLYHRSRVSNLAADHTIKTTYLLRRGLWG